MFIAVDEQKHKVSIMEAENGNNYYCPICGEKLTLKKNGKKKAPHFAHKPGSDCKDWGDMSEWHLNWQEKFPKEFREVVMEYKGEKHRADICIEESELVIEFQHSPISREDFHKRNCFYMGLGYQMVWVFDAMNKIKDLEEYRLIPNVIRKGYCLQDYFTQQFWWRRKQCMFEDYSDIVRKYYHDGGKLSLYFEAENSNSPQDKILLAATKVDQYEIEVYTTSRYITPQNFLKENGGYTEGDITGIRDIIQETQAMQEYIRRGHR